MAIVFNNRDRRVIPNWRSFYRTAQAGELNIEGKAIEIHKPKISLDEYYFDWKNNPTIAFAGDLLSVAISNNQTSSPQVKEIAHFIQQNAEEATPILLKASESVLLDFKEVDKKDNHVNIGLFELKNEELERYAEIHKYKQLIIRHPLNPVFYVEIARLYISVGMFQQAFDKMNIALYLSPCNRFVVRSAVRLFLHIGEIERAYYVLRKCSKFNDPWLLATEISLATILNKAQISVKKGMLIVDSRDYNDYSTSELSSAIATIEFLNGGFNKSRKFFEKALRDPNDNALAQVQWANNLDLNINFDSNILDQVCNIYEAKAWYAYCSKDYNKAIKYANEWALDMSFARTPIMFAFHLSNTYLKNFELSERILKKGLISNTTDGGLINNLAYIYALNGNVLEAQSLLNKVHIEQSNDSVKICLKATQGLIYFRGHQYEMGRIFYREAMEDALKQRNRPEWNWQAVLNYAREELLINSDYCDDIMSAVEKIPDNSSFDAINILKQEVLSLNEKRKNI